MNDKSIAKKHTYILPLLILAFSIIVFIGLSSHSPSIDKKQEPTRFLSVETVTVKPENKQLFVHSYGHTAPSIQTKLTSQVSGTVNKVLDGFVAGGLVKKNQILFTIDDSEYQVALRAQEAALSEAKANTSAQKAQAIVKRKLWTSTGKTLSEAPPLAIQQPQLDRAIAQEKAAEARLEQARINLGKTKIRSPYSGLVVNRKINLGQYITKGTIIGEVMSIDFAEVRLPLSSKQLEFLDITKFGAQHKKINVLFSNTSKKQNYVWNGYIIRSEGVVDSITRSHYLVARINDPYGIKNNQLPTIKMGTFVLAKISGKTLNNIFKVPKRLLRRNNEVLVTDISGRYLSYQKVNIIHQDDEYIYISKGLKEGDQLIISNLIDPIDGTKVIPSTKDKENI